MSKIKLMPLCYDKDGRMHYDGDGYPDNCSYCGRLVTNGVVILDTDLIFCNTECLVRMVEEKTADIRVEGGSKCIVN